MKLTEFGKAVRRARLDVDVSLLQMATSLGVTSAFLSGLETGRKKISKEWVLKVNNFFSSKGIQIEGLQEAADLSNKEVSLEGLSPTHQMLVAGFARASLDNNTMQKLKELLAASNKGE